MSEVRIPFLVDESVRYTVIAEMLKARRHIADVVTLREKDPAIIRTAEELGKVVITADADFSIELLRYPSDHENAYRRMGVVKLPNDAYIGQQTLLEWLPLVEAVWAQCQMRENKRFSIDLSNVNYLRIRFGNDPKPKPPEPGSSESHAEKRRRRNERRAALE